MSLETQQPKQSPPRKPLWPWVLLLVLTLMAIYSYNRVSEIIDDLIIHMPNAIVDMLDTLLGYESRHGAPPRDPPIKVDSTFL